MNTRSAMRALAWFATTSAALIVVPAAALAFPIDILVPELWIDLLLQLRMHSFEFAEKLACGLHQNPKPGQLTHGRADGRRIDALLARIGPHGGDQLIAQRPKQDLIQALLDHQATITAQRAFTEIGIVITAYVQSIVPC